MAFLKKSERHRETIYTLECILLGGHFLKSPVSHFSFLMLCLFYNGYNDIKNENPELNKQFVWENNTELKKQFVRENNSDSDKQFIEE